MRGRWIDAPERGMGISIPPVSPASRPVRLRLLLALCACFAAFAIAPAAANACASLAGIHSFVGHFRVTYSGSVSGPIVGRGGTEHISLHRSAASVEVNLKHKVRGKGQFAGIYFFTGRAHLGNVSVHDSFARSEGNLSAHQTYSGPLKGPGGAALALDTEDCKYQFSAHFGVKAKFSGDPTLRPGNGVFVSAYGDRNHIPRNLHLGDGAGPDPYLTCPGNPFLTGKPCARIGGGWANDFAELSECGQFPPEPTCGSGNEALKGSAEIIWVLKPK
jgi:hypothetical protein